MNDRFRFRAWNKTAKRYVDDVGELVFRKDGCVYFIGFSPTNNHEYIIEQCMGRQDVNGKLIFEGDVVAVLYLNLNPQVVGHKGLVKWDGFEFILKERCGAQLSLHNVCILSNVGMEILGNIHESPELMEV